MTTLCKCQKKLLQASLSRLPQGVVELPSSETQLTQLDTDLGKERSVLIFKYLQCSSDHDPKKYSRSNTERCKGGNSLPSGMELRWECFTLLKRCERPPQLKLAQGKSNQARNAYCFWDQVPQQAIQESPAAVDLTVTGLITQDGSLVNLPPC